MAKIGGNPQNFEKGTNFKDRPDRAVEAGRKGGLARGENFRKRRMLREELELLLDKIDSEGHSNQEKISLALLKQASKGNVKAFVAIRDTLGQMPTNKIEIEKAPTIIDDIEDDKNE